VSDTGITIRDVAGGDQAAWAGLFRAYRDFYRLAPDEDVVARVWTWLREPGGEVRGLVALDGDRVVGMAHYRRFVNPSEGSHGLYLDDLFTAPDARGRGVGRALIEHLAARAAQEGLSGVSWITAEDNRTARRLYDSVATATHWVTYELPATPQEGLHST
jgi:ribosomal protein S18 acetylase RimI-like enzyme